MASPKVTRKAVSAPFAPLHANTPLTVRRPVALAAPHHTGTTGVSLNRGQLKLASYHSLLGGFSTPQTSSSGVEAGVFPTRRATQSSQSLALWPVQFTSAKNVVVRST